MFEDMSRPDQDRCLGELPAGGGSIRTVVCSTTVTSVDSNDTFYEPAFGPDGRTLYLRESSPFESVTPSAAALMLAPANDLLAATAIRSYPYTASSGNIHGGISNIRWLSADRAIYLAQKVQYAAPCRGCPLDTLRTGLELVAVDLSGAAPVLEVIPNTSGASSVAAGENPDLVYLTKNGDGRVYRQVLSTGTTEIVHDFGSGNIARDVAVAGTTLYAIVGGRVSFVNDPTLGEIQRDFSGHLRRVDLTNGTETPLDVTDRWFRRPAASPAGNRLVAEAYLALVTSCAPPIGCLDTTISRSSDLWLFDVP